MRISLSIGGALLALAAFASTADARMGGGTGMSQSMSRGGDITSMKGSTHVNSGDRDRSSTGNFVGYLTHHPHSPSPEPPLACVGRIGGC